MAGLEYLKSKKGILKLLEELFNIIALACVASEATGPRGEAFLVASIGAFIITALIIFVRVLGLDEKISAPWSKIELGYCIIWGVFYLITSALVIDADAYNEYLGISHPFLAHVRIRRYIAGGSFGLFAVVTYFVDALFQYKSE